MAIIINPFLYHIVEEINFVNWNSPPIYDKYVDEDEANNHFLNELLLYYSSFGCYKDLSKYSKHDANGDASNLQGMDDGKVLLISQMNFEKNFKQSTIFVTSTWMEQGGVPPSSSPAVMLKEATHNILRGFKMHSSGWKSFSIKKKEPGPTTFERMGTWSFHEYFVAWNTLIAMNFILLLWLLCKNLQGHPKDRGRANETRGRVFFEKGRMMREPRL
ncbi:cellulose synthase 3 [Pyrus ussuriensis x Pyrus communis]|uniref:Cellulose synthase 3 n=1 Tax=Pyrus ussuriensis x Pyrus communis TaxID=2448454 RepID=A0A5N5FPJ3_9ROSA|nr:cellulose synthase 3 [Pyrus ussuriensis x Pyrus communis]